MDIKKLFNHPLITRAELARRMYPDLETRSATSKLNMKISGAQGRGITKFEERRLLLIWNEFKNEIEI